MNNNGNNPFYTNNQKHPLANRNLIPEFVQNITSLGPSPFRQNEIIIEQAPGQASTQDNNLFDFWKEHNEGSRPSPAAPKNFQLPTINDSFANDKFTSMKSVSSNFFRNPDGPQPPDTDQFKPPPPKFTKVGCFGESSESIFMAKKNQASSILPDLGSGFDMYKGAHAGLGDMHSGFDMYKGQLELGDMHSGFDALKGAPMGPNDIGSGFDMYKTGVMGPNEMDSSFEMYKNNLPLSDVNSGFDNFPKNYQRSDFGSTFEAFKNKVQNTGPDKGSEFWDLEKKNDAVSQFYNKRPSYNHKESFDTKPNPLPFPEVNLPGPNRHFPPQTRPLSYILEVLTKRPFKEFTTATSNEMRVLNQMLYEKFGTNSQVDLSTMISRAKQSIQGGSAETPLEIENVMQLEQSKEEKIKAKYAGFGKVRRTVQSKRKSRAQGKPRMIVEVDFGGISADTAQASTQRKRVLQALVEFGQRHASKVNLEFKLKRVVCTSAKSKPIQKLPLPLSNPFTSGGCLPGPIQHSIKPMPKPKPRVESVGSFKSFTKLKEKQTSKGQSDGSMDREEAMAYLKRALRDPMDNAFADVEPKAEPERLRQQILENIFEKLSKIKYFSADFDKCQFLMHLINLQLSFRPQSIRFPSLKVRLRALCLLFCKYTNRTRLLSAFAPFFPEIDFKSLKTVSKYLSSKRATPSTRDQASDDSICDFFYFRNVELGADPKERQSPGMRRRLNVIKKLLVYFVMVMDLFKCYLYVKTDQSFGDSHVAADVHSRNRRKLDAFVKLDQFKETPRPRFEVDSSLWALPLGQLLDRVDLSLYPAFITLSNLFIMKSLSSKVATLNLAGREFKFTVTFEEQQWIMCSKIKRKDELIKFSYRFIRKQIFKAFKQRICVEGENLRLEEIRRRFNEVYLKGDPRIVEYYKSVDISKKRLNNLAECRQLRGEIDRYKQDKYFPKQIEKMVFYKDDQIFQDQLTFDVFLKTVFCSQFKNSMILQDIIQSYFIFESFFQF